MQIAMHHVFQAVRQRRIKIDGVRVVAGEFAARSGNAPQIGARRILFKKTDQGGFQDVHECAVGIHHVLRRLQVPFGATPAFVHFRECVNQSSECRAACGCRAHTGFPCARRFRWPRDGGCGFRREY